MNKAYTAMNKTYDAIGGRTFAFICACLLIGTALVIFRRLTGEWVAMVSALAGVLAARAVGSDRFGYYDRPRGSVEVSTLVSTGGIEPGPPVRDWRQGK